jgi:hypothetical protein
VVVVLGGRQTGQVPGGLVPARIEASGTPSWSRLTMPPVYAKPGICAGPVRRTIEPLVVLVRAGMRDDSVEGGPTKLVSLPGPSAPRDMTWPVRDPPRPAPTLIDAAGFAMRGPDYATSLGASRSRK